MLLIRKHRDASVVSTGDPRGGGVGGASLASYERRRRRWQTQAQDYTPPEPAVARQAVHEGSKRMRRKMRRRRMVHLAN